MTSSRFQVYIPRIDTVFGTNKEYYDAYFTAYKVPSGTYPNSYLPGDVPEVVAWLSDISLPRMMILITTTWQHEWLTFMLGKHPELSKFLKYTNTSPVYNLIYIDSPPRLRSWVFCNCDDFTVTEF